MTRGRLPINNEFDSQHRLADPLNKWSQSWRPSLPICPAWHAEQALLSSGGVSMVRFSILMSSVLLVYWSHAIQVSKVRSIAPGLPPCPQYWLTNPWYFSWWKTRHDSSGWRSSGSLSSMCIWHTQPWSKKWIIYVCGRKWVGAYFGLISLRGRGWEHRPPAIITWVPFAGLPAPQIKATLVRCGHFQSNIQVINCKY